MDQLSNKHMVNLQVQTLLTCLHQKLRKPEIKQTPPLTPFPPPTCIYYRFFEESSNNQISNSKKTMFEIIYEAVRWTRDLFNIFKVFCWPKLPNPWRKPAMWQLWQLSWHAKKNLSPQKEELPIKYVFGLRFLNELIHLKRHSKKISFFL